MILCKNEADGCVEGRLWDLFRTGASSSGGGSFFYAIEDQKLVRKDEKPACGYIQIVSKAEFAQQYGMLDESGLLLYHYEENSIDNIDVFEDHVVGTFVVPMKEACLKARFLWGFM